MKILRCFAVINQGHVRYERVLYCACVLQMSTQTLSDNTGFHCYVHACQMGQLRLSMCNPTCASQIQYTVHIFYIILV